MKKIIIAGTGSGCGKTAVTCGILKALCKRGLKVSSFKCGPDYIDPMFHQKVIGTGSHNLDSFFCSNDTINFILSDYGENSDISVIEGVMGYYDGTDDGRGSAYSVSHITNTPAIIVVDCKGMSDSVGAVIKGFLTYKNNSNIAGFIFNRLPLSLHDKIRRICQNLGTEFFGIMPKNDAVIESRHLGLVTADEISDISCKLETLGKLAEENILLDRIIQHSESDLPEFLPPVIQKKYSVKIAVANDEAFCFLYSENIGLLENMGCEIIYFSPVHDKKLPENINGIILCGGYPELYAKQLSENITMLQSIKKAIRNNIPVIAECGGFMYLHEYLKDAGNQTYTMVGAVNGTAFPTDRLQRFGYVTMTANRDSMLAQCGEKIPAHEFHYYDSTDCGNGFTAEKTNKSTWSCGIVNDNIYAGFPHLYFYGCINTAERFVRKCSEYGG